MDLRKLLGGVTFGTETAAVVGGAVGASVTPALDVFGEIGYMQNVLPNDLQENIDDQAALLSIILRVPIAVISRYQLFMAWAVCGEIYLRVDHSYRSSKAVQDSRESAPTSTLKPQALTSLRK